jgi:hypothetical protein
MFLGSMKKLQKISVRRVDLMFNPETFCRDYAFDNPMLLLAGLDDWGPRVQFPLHPEQLWGPHSLLYSGYQGLFP